MLKLSFSCKSVASRCIELFVRHACLLRPLTDFGRTKLIVDFSQVYCNMYIYTISRRNFRYKFESFLNIR